MIPFKRRRFLLIVLVVIAIGSLSGCSGFGKKMKSFLGGGKGDAAGVPKAARAKASFKTNPNHMAGPRRQYKRVTKKSIQNESQLDANSGSLWVMEGQGAFLFSQNIMRMIGDPLSVKITGEPKAQLSAKVKVIGKLLKKLEDRKKAALRKPASKGAAAQAANPTGQQPDAKPPGANPAKGEADDGDFSVKTVPTRVVERLVDGNYRVKGSQPFMIGSREYKVIVTGIVRAEDFSDDGISASQLLDPNYDIVATRKRESM